MLSSYSRTTISLVAVSVMAWIGTISWALLADMGAMPGTMGMSLLTFTAMWMLMMAAMMLPSVGPFIHVYQRTVKEHRGPRLTALTAGYLSVWGASALVAFAIAGWFGELARQNAMTAQIVAVVTFAAVGAYQLSPLKYKCLSHCRTPFGHLVHYFGFQGPLRDLKAGASHGWFCLGCCWALMLLMVAFGVMNVAAMIGLAVVIGVEKLWRHGETFAKSVGAASFIFAGALIFSPELAPGLDPGALMHMSFMGR